MSIELSIRIKSFVKKTMPGLVPILRHLRDPGNRALRRSVFRAVYEQNAWAGGEGWSPSGPGSSLLYTESIRAALPDLVRKFAIRTLLDAPCGDFTWMAHVELELDEYTGLDIVPELIARNSRLYGRAGRRFLIADVVHQRLPRADLVLCRDCLVHLPMADALKVVRRIVRSKSRYLLATTFPVTGLNIDVATGGWRPLNLQDDPFCFPQPLQLINENQTKDPRYGDKSLGLWRISDLKTVGKAKVNRAPSTVVD